MSVIARPRPVSAEVRVRYCVRELENGTRCNHHIIVHRGGEGRCTGFDVYGLPCPCGAFRAPDDGAAT